jgi:hypothetical protein
VPGHAWGFDHQPHDGSFPSSSSSAAHSLFSIARLAEIFHFLRIITPRLPRTTPDCLNQDSNDMASSVTGSDGSPQLNGSVHGEKRKVDGDLGSDRQPHTRSKRNRYISIAW